MWALFGYLFKILTGESSQHISISFSHIHLPSQLTLSFVHALCTKIDRKELWTSLLRDNPGSGAWVVGGDFIVIIDAHQKRGGMTFQSF